MFLLIWCILSLQAFPKVWASEKISKFRIKFYKIINIVQSAFLEAFYYCSIAVTGTVMILGSPFLFHYRYSGEIQYAYEMGDGDPRTVTVSIIGWVMK
jgi:hypothetical protein